MKKLILLIGTLCFIAMGANAYAFGVSIGLDTTGTGSFSEIDRIVWSTDTGLSVGYDGTKTVLTSADYYDTTFRLQAYAASVQNDGQTVFTTGISSGAEQLTFTAKFTETVISQIINPAGHQVASFTYGEDPSSTFDLYIDTETNADPTGATGYALDATATNILSAHLLSVTSSFDAAIPGTLGTGSFDVRVAVDSYNSSYLDLYGQDYLMFRIFSTGTLNEPPDFEPSQMWDGTDTDDGIMLKFTGESTFEVSAIPEPSTMLLLGTGLLGFVGVIRKRNQK